MKTLPRGGVFAILLILAGTILFLDNVGILPIHNLQAFWPVFIVFLGITMLERFRNPHSVIFGCAFVAWGTLLILGNLGILHVTGAVMWPLMLIAFGVAMLVRPPNFAEWQARHQAHRERWAAAHRERLEAHRERFEARRERWEQGRERWRSRWDPRDIFNANKLHESTVFGSINKRVQTQQFEGGKVEAVFGSVELDLTEAAISTPDRRAKLKADAVFGGIEITIPRTWRVQMRTSAVLGGCDDRTIPPRPEPGIEPPTLILTGAAVFGGIQIRN